MERKIFSLWMRISHRNIFFESGDGQIMLCIKENSFTDV